MCAAPEDKNSARSPPVETIGQHQWSLVCIWYHLLCVYIYNIILLINAASDSNFSSDLRNLCPDWHFFDFHWSIRDKVASLRGQLLSASDSKESTLPSCLELPWLQVLSPYDLSQQRGQMDSKKLVLACRLPLWYSVHVIPLQGACYLIATVSTKVL